MNECNVIDCLNPIEVVHGSTFKLMTGEVMHPSIKLCGMHERLHQANPQHFMQVIGGKILYSSGPK